MYSVQYMRILKNIKIYTVGTVVFLFAHLIFVVHADENCVNCKTSTTLNKIVIQML